MLKECNALIYELSNIFQSTLLHIFAIGRTSIFNRRLNEVPEREKEKISCYAYMRAPEKNENTSRRGLTYTEILKGGPRNIRKTFERTNDANLFSSPFPLFLSPLIFFLILLFLFSLRAKAQIILGASCCNTLIQSQESRLLRQNRSLISTLRPCDSVMKIEWGTYTFAKRIRSVPEAYRLPQYIII